MANLQNDFLAAFAALNTPPKLPARWSQRYVNDIIARCDKRIDALPDRMDAVSVGRVMPDIDQVTIGSGKHFRLAVLFLDICGFSDRPNWTQDEQKQVLCLMNIFMAEMLNVVRDFGGTYEKNTGDGLMAYFGEGADTDAERVRPAVEAAVIMHYVNDYLMTPWFQKQGIQPVRFRVGIDAGPATIARVGLRGTESSIVAIGTTANIACKLMNLIPAGGICIGHFVYENLPDNWNQACKQCEQDTGFVYRINQNPYRAWELNHRLTRPMF
jgi:class 3 adenylate cyclase